MPLVKRIEESKQPVRHRLPGQVGVDMPKRLAETGDEPRIEPRLRKRNDLP